MKELFKTKRMSHFQTFHHDIREKFNFKDCSLLCGNLRTKILQREYPNQIENVSKTSKVKWTLYPRVHNVPLCTPILCTSKNAIVPPKEKIANPCVHNHFFIGNDNTMPASRTTKK